MLTVAVMIPVGMFLWRGCQPTMPPQQVMADGEIRNPAGAGARYPALVADGAGGWVLSWTVAIDEEIDAVMVTTLDSAGRWTEPTAAVVAPDLFVNWADFPAPAVLSAPTAESTTGSEQSPSAAPTLAAHWLKRHPAGGTYAYDVQVAFRAPSDARWGPPVTPHTDGTPTEHGFVSLQPLPEASDGVLALWLDGREMAGGDSHGGEASDGSHAMSGAMTLRSAQIDPSGTLRHSRVVDDRVCECCQTDMTRLADGRYVAVYRGRSSEEVRDPHAAFYDPASGRWSAPEPVHRDGWTIGGCPVNGPAVAASAAGHAGVLWYTEADSVPSVRFALHGGGEGAGFSDPIRLERPEARTAGRVDLAAAGDLYYALWTEYYRHPEIDGPSGLATLRLTVLDVSEGAPRVVETRDLGLTGSSRASGFPRMAISGGDLLVAWTETDPQYRLRTLRLPTPPGS